MVNNYPKYAAGVNFKKTDSNGVRHFYSAQVVADPSDDTIESKLIKDGVVISEGGGGGSSDFSTVEVTITSEAERWECGLNVPAIISDTLNIYNEIYENTTLNVVLYKGSCIGVIYSETMDVGVSGNATLDGEHITITGNCIITLSQK